MADSHFERKSHRARAYRGRIVAAARNLLPCTSARATRAWAGLAAVASPRRSFPGLCSSDAEGRGRRYRFVRPPSEPEFRARLGSSVGRRDPGRRIARALRGQKEAGPWQRRRRRKRRSSSSHEHREAVPPGAGRPLFVSCVSATRPRDAPPGRGGACPRPPPRDVRATARVAPERFVSSPTRRFRLSPTGGTHQEDDVVAVGLHVPEVKAPDEEPSADAKASRPQPPRAWQELHRELVAPHEVLHLRRRLGG